MRLVPPLATAALVLSLGAVAPAEARSPSPDARVVATVDRAKTPGLKVKKLVTGLDLVWDVRALTSKKLIFTQRNRATISTFANGEVRRIKGFPSNKIWVSGETGLLGLYVDPDDNHRIYTCQGWRSETEGPDVRVIAWTLDERFRRVYEDRTLVKGFPVSSGRHGGCRILVDGEGALVVGTGDAAQGTNPRNLDSLGGKTLRVDRYTGKPWPSNRWADAAGKRRYVHTFGHRNVQGLALRKDGSVWSMEHGPDRDDEVNLLINGRDYGWHPVPGYNESVPMTDQGLPGRQVAARWSSGYPTLATSGGTFVYGKEWGSLKGALAVACLKASRVVFMTFDKKGRLVRKRVPTALTRYGRVRTVTQAPDGSLLVATSNGGGRDLILRVTPR
jgi:glucose/arabinose dehydrogenase